MGAGTSIHTIYLSACMYAFIFVCSVHVCRYLDRLLVQRRRRGREAPTENGSAAGDMSFSVALSRFFKCVPRGCLSGTSFQSEYYTDLNAALTARLASRAASGTCCASKEVVLQ